MLGCGWAAASCGITRLVHSCHSLQTCNVAFIDPLRHSLLNGCLDGATSCCLPQAHQHADVSMIRFRSRFLSWNKRRSGAEAASNTELRRHNTASIRPVHINLGVFVERAVLGNSTSHSFGPGLPSGIISSSIYSRLMLQSSVLARRFPSNKHSGEAELFLKQLFSFKSGNIRT